MLPPILIFLIVLSILVFVHELGHFLVAKNAGIKVLEFGFGYPPRIWGKKVGETIYSLNWIPFGGFVRLLGQEKAEKKSWTEAEKKRAFFAQPKKAKVPVLIAGILGNILLGVVCFSILYSKLGIPTPLEYIKIVEVVPNSPAAESDMMPGTGIMSIGDQRIETVSDFINVIENNTGQEIKIFTTGKAGPYVLTPRENPPENEGRIGVMITDVENKFYPWWQMPFLSAWYGIKEAVAWSVMILGGIVMTIGQLFKGVTPEVAGPVGIFQLTTAAAKQGILDLIQFVGILSINLGILNLLPFPALDGGHLLFVFLGKLVKEEKWDKIEHVVNTIGFIFLLSLMILVTVNDFVRLLGGISIASFFKSLF